MCAYACVYMCTCVCVYVCMCQKTFVITNHFSSLYGDFTIGLINHMKEHDLEKNRASENRSKGGTHDA